ncbi:putative mitochondrial large ribosomal subunit [Diplodia seriata]|uniref:Large ribosomal subunit protein mL49 n=1 Tax=Diplodia seriata TaxID=420778 RepID=A0A0G2DUM0_9PEZI|nr:putative mitochondrial large ribosomal subunit [Diplodia seriata]
MRSPQAGRYAAFSTLAQPAMLTERVAEITTASTTAPVDANAPAVEQVRPPILPYFVQRTPSNNLPVYNAQKRGGNRKETKLRKISGDVKALQSELRAYLDIPEHDITINPTTGHIIAKGDHYMKIVEFLKSKQF